MMLRLLYSVWSLRFPQVLPATLSLPQSSSNTSDVGEDDDDDEGDDDPEIGIGWNLAGTCKIENEFTDYCAETRRI